MGCSGRAIGCCGSRDGRCALSDRGPAGLVQSDETERLLHGVGHLLRRVRHTRLRPSLDQYDTPSCVHFITYFYAPISTIVSGVL